MNKRFTRREMLTTGSLALAGSVAGLSFDPAHLLAQEGSTDQHGTTAANGRVSNGKPLVIDVHAHLWTDDYLDLVESFGKKDTNIQRGREAGTKQAEIEKRFATMDSADVDLQVLSVTPQSPHFENKEHAVAAARKANDMYAEAVQRWPKRFAALAALPLPHVDESLREIDRAIGQLGMRGVGITTDILGRSIADPAFAPIYEELNRRRSVLFIHPAGDGAYSPLITDYQIIWMIGAPVEDTVAVLHLITRGIPSRFPQMKIITAHVGGALPILLERLDSVSTWEDPQIAEKPSLAARRMWYDTVDYGDVPALRSAVDRLGATQVVLGSDFPYENGDLYRLAVNYIRNAGLTHEDVARILTRNASGLLGFA
jgi:predicted TIM-barrel fold metal-dependent hydrolase